MLELISQGDPGNSTCSRNGLGRPFDGSKLFFKAHASAGELKESRFKRPVCNPGVRPGFDETPVRLADFCSYKDEIPGGLADRNSSKKVSKPERSKPHVTVGQSEARNSGIEEIKASSRRKPFAGFFFWREKGAGGTPVFIGSGIPMGGSNR